MPELYSVDKENKIVVHKEALKLTKYLSKISQPALLFIAVCYDYDGLFAAFPEQERIKKSKMFSFGTATVPQLDSEDIQKAIQEYLDLQYCPHRRLITIYSNKIEEYLFLLENEREPSKVLSFSKVIEQLEEKIEKEQEKIQKTQKEKARIAGDRKLSFIEEMQNKNRAAKKANLRKDQFNKSMTIE
jgi:hypothetical protein